MEPITFDLIDGYKEPATGAVHKSVRMHQLTMKEQIAIKGDERARKLLSSPYSLSSDNQVNRMLALTEYQEFYCILFSQTVDAIGDVTRDKLQAYKAFESLTSRDIGLMIQYQNGAGGKLIRVEKVLAILESVIMTDEMRLDLRQRLEGELGEAQAATEP